MLRYVQLNQLYPSIQRRREALAAIAGATPSDARALCDARTLGLIASFQRAVVDDLKRKTFRAAQAVGAETVLVSGGVAANRELRVRFTAEAGMRGMSIAFPSSSALHRQRSHDRGRRMAQVRFRPLRAHPNSPLNLLSPLSS